MNYQDAGPPPPRLSVMGGLGGVAGRGAGCRPRQQDTSWVPPASDEGGTAAYMAWQNKRAFRILKQRLTKLRLSVMPAIVLRCGGQEMPDLEEISWELTDDLPPLIPTETSAVEGLIIGDYTNIVVTARSHSRTP